MEETTWQDRVIEEQDDLKLKIGKLAEFYRSDGYSFLTPRQQTLLTKQHAIMLEYSQILSERLAASEV